MKQTINFSQFCDAFHPENVNQFSYEGKRALFDYLEQYEEKTKKEIELNTYAIRGKFTEYDNLEELQHDYKDIGSIEDLEKETTVIRIEGTDGLIIADYWKKDL